MTSKASIWISNRERIENLYTVENGRIFTTVYGIHLWFLATFVQNHSLVEIDFYAKQIFSLCQKFNNRRWIGHSLTYCENWRVQRFVKTQLMLNYSIGEPKFLIGRLHSNRQKSSLSSLHEKQGNYAGMNQDKFRISNIRYSLICNLLTLYTYCNCS